MSRSADQVLFSILRSRALVPDDRLQGALQTAEREEIPLERVLLREGLLKATTCEHVIQSRAQRARSCTRCGEFTYLQEDQGVHDTACERCGGPLQRTVADAGPAAGRAAGGSPAVTTGGVPGGAPRNNGPGTSGPATRRGPPSGSGPAGRESAGRDLGGAARRTVRRQAGGPVPAALKGAPSARTPVGGSPRPSAAPPRAEIKAALANTRDAVKQIADLARPVGEGIEPAPTPPPAERSGARSRSAPPPLRTQRAGAEDPPTRTPSGARPRPEPARIEPARIEPARIEPAREEPAREEPAREEPARTGRPAAPAGGESTSRERGEASQEDSRAGATASALEPLLEDAALRLHARLALELRGILSAEADAAAERAIKNVVSQAEDKLEARTRRLEAGLADSARSAAESAVEEVRETRTATPGESELSAWSALVAERVRTALLGGEVPPAWEERANAAAERTAREVAAREAAQAVEAQAAALTAQAAAISAQGAPQAAPPTGPAQLDDQALEHVTARVLESIWAHLESNGLEGFPGRVVEGVTERARAAAEERVQALPAPEPARAPAAAELDAAGLEQVTARTLESIWAHLESSGLEGFPARVVEGVIERARAVASERGEPPAPEELRDQAVQGLLALWQAEGAAALPERVREELLAGAAEAASAAQAAQVAPLSERLEQVENTQRESHLLGAEERATLEARLAALEARLQVEPVEPGADPLRAVERRLAALEEAQAVSLAAQARADAARALAPADDAGPREGGAGAVTHEALEQAIQVALDALEERLQARVDALVANLELRLTTTGDGSSGREALPDEPGPTLEEVDQRVMAALEAHRPAAPELDLEDVAGRVALMATAPVMHAIDQRLAQIDNEVVKRITRQVYAEMRQMAEERRSGKIVRGDIGGD